MTNQCTENPLTVGKKVYGIGVANKGVTKRNILFLLAGKREGMKG